MSDTSRSPDPTNFERMFEVLFANGLCDDEFLRDAIWLSLFVPKMEPERSSSQSAAKQSLQSDSGGARQQKPDEREVVPSGGQKDPEDDNPSTPTSSIPKGNLYPPFSLGYQTQTKATPVYVPAAGSLPQPLELAQALRPFHEKHRSKRLLKLDVDATVELTADRRQLTPILTEARERWFSISLVLDDSPSMAVWRKTAREFSRFLGTLGIFRDVRFWSFDANLEFRSPAGRTASPKQLVDPTGRTLVLVLTHGVGSHWQSRELAEWLVDCARWGPVAICSLLPPARWENTDLGPAYLRARAATPGIGNRLLTVFEGKKHLGSQADRTVFPVFSLTKQGLAEWAAMHMSRHETTVPAVPISPSWFIARKDIEPEPAPDVAGRLADFRSFASSDAVRLLGYLSAIPLYLPIVRLVQYTMMPESPLSALAEVLMSGLVVPHPASPESAEPDNVLFDFAPDARQYLLDRTSIRDAGSVQIVVKDAIREYIEKRAGISIADFVAWLEDPEGAKDLPPDVQHFVQVEAETLRSMGYRRHQIFADRRLIVFCACRSRTLPDFIVAALGSDPSDQRLIANGSLTITTAGEISIAQPVHKKWHGKATPDTHLRLAKAIATNPFHEFSLRERIFHLREGGMLKEAVAVTKDVRWLIPAAELDDPFFAEDMLSVGMGSLLEDLRVGAGGTVRARLASSQDQEIARAAIRYLGASRYVQVVGTGRGILDEIRQASASAIGRMLGEAGLGLITGGWPGVDYVAASSYLQAGGKSLVHIMSKQSSLPLQGALLIEQRQKATGAKLADGLVLIGGAGPTLDLYHEARRYGIPVYPYGLSRGDAAKALGLLQGTGARWLESDLNPEEFASAVVSAVSDSKVPQSLAKMWVLAADYDHIRKEMEAGGARTIEMTKIFHEMCAIAADTDNHLTDLKTSASPGRRLGAIAILFVHPRVEELDWLAGRLDNPEKEKPFVGFQAAAALMQAVKHLAEDHLRALELALRKALILGSQLPSDSDRLVALTQAERQLALRRTSQENESEVTQLVYRELAERRLQETVTSNLLIFKTSKQRTWLSFSTAGVICVLDNRLSKDDYFGAQWFQTLDSIKPSSIAATDKRGNTGLLAIGTRRNWLYSRNLFSGDELRSRVLEEFERAKELRGRIRRYRLESTI